MPKDLPTRIARLQTKFVRDVNDMHIFLKQAMPILETARAAYKASQSDEDRKYYVPSVGKIKFAQRTDKELQDIYNRFTQRELYGTFLVGAVSRFEAFLSDVLKTVLTAYPAKLHIAVTGITPCKDVPTELLLRSTDLDSVIGSVIVEHVRRVMYASPKEYLAYFEKAVGVGFSKEEKATYIEIKATRDLIVHGSGKVNDMYVTKAGKKARGSLDDFVSVDEQYFSSSIAMLKRLAGSAKRDAEMTFPRK